VVPALFGGRLGVTEVRRYGRLVFFLRYMVAAAGVLLWRRGSFVVLVVWRASGFRGVIGMSLM